MRAGAGDQKAGAEVPRPDRCSWSFAQVVLITLAGVMLWESGPGLLIEVKPLGDPFTGIVIILLVAFPTIATSVARAGQLSALKVGHQQLALLRDRGGNIPRALTPTPSWKPWKRGAPC
jgi:hypothetical protein